MEELVKLLKENNLTISSCESLTGGMFASSIVNVSGASSVFTGSLITYQDKCKEILLDGKKILDNVGAISEEMSILMSKKTQEILKTNIAISFTGNAGPLPSEDKPVGLVYSCIVFNNLVFTYKNIYNGNRKEIREKCIIDGKNRIIEIIKSNL